LKWLAVLWLALWLAPAWAQEPAGACTAQVSSVQVAKGSDDGRRPDAAQWQPVQLPDDWSARWPGYSGTAWYRIGWRHDWKSRWQTC